MALLWSRNVVLLCTCSLYLNKVGIYPFKKNVVHGIAMGVLLFTQTQKAMIGQTMPLMVHCYYYCYIHSLTLPWLYSVVLKFIFSVCFLILFLVPRLMEVIELLHRLSITTVHFYNMCMWWKSCMRWWATSLSLSHTEYFSIDQSIKFWPLQYLMRI